MCINIAHVCELLVEYGGEWMKTKLKRIDGINVASYRVAEGDVSAEAPQGLRVGLPMALSPHELVHVRV